MNQLSQVVLDDITVKFHNLEGEIEAVKNISFYVKKGEFLGIVGPSGCGKSTLLNIISGLISPTRGNAYLAGKRINKPTSMVGYMPQSDQLFGWRTIWKNVLIGLEIQNKINDKTISYTEKLLKDYGLADFKHYYPNQLSGGMRQRVSLIRTLTVDPEIMLLDEPFSALDYQTRLLVADEVKQIITKENKTTILVTHDIAEAISMADRIVILSKRPGKVKRILDINLTTKNNTPIHRREAPEFRYFFNEIWKELDIDEK